MNASRFSHIAWESWLFALIPRSMPNVAHKHPLTYLLTHSLTHIAQLKRVFRFSGDIHSLNNATCYGYMYFQSWCVYIRISWSIVHYYLAPYTYSYPFCIQHFTPKRKKKKPKRPKSLAAEVSSSHCRLQCFLNEWKWENEWMNECAASAHEPLALIYNIKNYICTLFFKPILWFQASICFGCSLRFEATADAALVLSTTITCHRGE